MGFCSLMARSDVVTMAFLIVALMIMSFVTVTLVMVSFVGMTFVVVSFVGCGGMSASCAKADDQCAIK